MSLYEYALMVQVCINILLAMSVFVPLSIGQLNLGSAGFMGIGAYTAGKLATQGLPSFVGIPAAIVLGGLVGLLIGLPILRVKGIYLAMATFAFGIVMESVFLVLPFTGAERGIGGVPAVPPAVIFGWTLVPLLIVYLLTRSHLWTRVRAIHEDEFAAALSGLDPAKLKIVTFGVSGALAGLAGSLYAHWYTYIEPGAFSLQVSVFAVLFVVLGGRRSFWGPILGATVLTLLPEVLRGLNEWRSAFVGAVLLVFLIWRPSGIVSREPLVLNPMKTRKGVSFS